MVINLSTWVPIVEGLVTIIALAIASYVGLAGLGAWKQQLSSQEDHDLARRLLLAAYRLRDAISDARIFRPMMKELDAVAKGRLREFEAPKLEEMNAARRELDLGMREAEASWGLDVSHALERLSILAGDIKSAYDIYDWFGAGEPFQPQEHTKVLFRSWRDEPDEFAKQMQDAMTHLDDLLRPKLLMNRPRSRGKRFWKWLRR